MGSIKEDEVGKRKDSVFAMDSGLYGARIGFGGG
jgi:hypothetical protein